MVRVRGRREAGHRHFAATPLDCRQHVQASFRLTPQSPNLLTMRKRNTIRELGRMLGLASAEAWTSSEIDSDTLRRRALDDARGQIMREGCVYSAAGETHFTVRRSVQGRTNQYDLTHNGVVVLTAGSRELKP